MKKLMLQILGMVAILTITMAPEVTVAAAEQGTTSTQQANAPNEGNPLNSAIITNAFNPENMSPFSRKHYCTIFGSASGIFGESCPDTAGGYVLGVFNIIAMIMGVIVIGYVIMGGAINTAASGEALGRSWSSVWLPIRVSTAFGLTLVTAATAPYSPSQLAVFYAAMVGDNIATSATKVLADKVASREVVMAGGIPRPPTSLSYDIAGSAFCAANEWNMVTANGETNTDKFSLFKITYSAGPISKTEGVKFGKMPGTYNIPSGSIETISFGHTGQCGSMDFANTSGLRAIPGIGLLFKSEETEKAYDAANKIILAELTYYAELEAEFRKEGFGGAAIESALKTFNPLDETHPDLISQYAKAINDRVNSFPDRLSEALKNGYGTRDPKSFIGRDVVHYTDINKLMHKMAEYSSAPNAAMENVISSTSNKAWDICFVNSDECGEKPKSELVKELNEGVQMQSTMPSMLIIGMAMNGDGTSKSVAGTDVKGMGFDGKIEHDKLMNRMAKVIKVTVLKVVSDLGSIPGGTTVEGVAQNPGTEYFTLNPMVFMHNMGHALVAMVMILFAGLMAAGAISTATSTSILTSTFGGGGLKGAFDILMLFAGPALLFCAFAGMSLTLISLIPIVVGIWGYLSILMMAIQGAAAAPFAVILLTTPEGEGATNQTFQRFLLHMTHLFLAPMIFVLGAVMSIAVTVVGANIVIFTFVYDMNFFGSDSWLVIIASIFVFVWVLYRLVLKLALFQLSLQNDIMEILGGAFHKPMGGDVAGEVMQISGQTNAAMGGFGKAATDVTNKIRTKRGLAPIGNPMGGNNP